MCTVRSSFQEPDYGALYEGRNPGFYVEANPMPTFKVQPRASGRRKLERLLAAQGLYSLQGRGGGCICGRCGEVVFVVSQVLRACERCVVGV